MSNITADIDDLFSYLVNLVKIILTTFQLTLCPVYLMMQNIDLTSLCCVCNISKRRRKEEGIPSLLLSSCFWRVTQHHAVLTAPNCSRPRLHSSFGKILSLFRRRHLKFGPGLFRSLLPDFSTSKTGHSVRRGERPPPPSPTHFSPRQVFRGEKSILHT